MPAFNTGPVLGSSVLADVVVAAERLRVALLAAGSQRDGMVPLEESD